MNKSEEAQLCIQSLTVFLAKTVYIHLTPGHFVHSTSPRHSVCLTRHMFVLTMQKAEPNRPTVPTHAFGLSIYSATILILRIQRCHRADINAPLQCLIRLFLIYFFPPRSQVSASGHSFFTTHAPFVVPYSLLIPPVD